MTKSTRFARRGKSRIGRKKTIIHGKPKGRRASSRSNPRSPKRQRTMTRTKRKLDQTAKITTLGSMSSFNHGSRGKSMVAKLQKVFTKLVTVVNETNLLQNNAGLQLTATQNALFNVAEITTMVNQVLGGATPTGYRTAKILLKQVTSELMITSAETVSQRVDIYDVMLRKDLFPYNVLGGGTTTITPDSAWSQGVVNEGGAAANIQILGTTPFDSQLFCEHYKIQKITHVELGPGQTHCHRVKYAPNRLFNADELYQTNVTAFGHLTCYSLVVAYGSPVLNLAGTGATTAPARIMTIAKREYEFGAIQQNIKTITTSNALSGNIAAANDEVNTDTAVKQALGTLF